MSIPCWFNWHLYVNGIFCVGCGKFKKYKATQNMEYKYLKIMGSIVWGTNDLNKDDLGRLKQHNYDAIVDTEEGKTFDADSNKWKEIEGS